MKLSRKLLSLTLALVMLLSCCTAMAYAAATYEHLPQIYVEGLDSKRIYYKDDPEKNPLFFPIDAEMMISNLTKYEKYLKLAIHESNPNLLYNYLCLWMQDCFGMIALDKDGYTMSEEVTVNETTLNYDGDGKYVFKYDSRLDPVDIAKELKEYVALVQQDSGSQRFELAGSSYGASVVCAYLNEYPDEHKNIDSVVLCVPSTNGVNFAGELFSGSFNLDPDALQAFLDKMVANDDLTLFISVLNKTGALDSILDAALEPILEAALMDALRTVIREIFGTFPSMWSFVDDRYFDAALKNIYGKNYADPEHEYAGLINKITYYHDNIMVRSDEIIKNLLEENININIICKYGNAPIPLSKEGNFTGDGLVALEMASFGATCKMNGERLPADYKQSLYPEYNLLSPDGMVDASTGLIPFNTWFVKGLNHGEKSDGYYELINRILYDDLDVFTNPKYPQYLEVPEYDDEALVVMSPGEAAKKETSWLQDFLTLIFRLLKTIIEKLKVQLFK